MRKFLIFIVFVLVLSFGINYMSDYDKYIDFGKGLKYSENIDTNNSDNKTLSNDDEDKETEDGYNYTHIVERTELDVQTEEEESVKISFAGDVLLANGVEALIEQKGADFIISDVKGILEQSDISMVNLECPISERGTKAQDKQYTFRAKPESLEVLKSSGVDIVTLANNHILDFGIEALLDTLQNLNDNGIKYVGAGINMDEASKPIFIDIKGVKMAFIASSRVIPDVSWAAGEDKPGVAVTYDPNRILKEISYAKEQADIVAVYIHWGQELMDYPLEYQKSLAKAYIDEGADIVVGSHPHVLQGLEFYKGKVIAYSLGNFIFTNTKKDTMILQIEVDRSGVINVQIIPSRVEYLRPIVISDKNESDQLLKKIESLSSNIEIDMNGFVNSLP